MIDLVVTIIALEFLSMYELRLTEVRLDYSESCKIIQKFTNVQHVIVIQMALEVNYGGYSIQPQNG